MINAVILVWFIRSFSKFPADIAQAIQAYREAQS